MLGKSGREQHQRQCREKSRYGVYLEEMLELSVADSGLTSTRGETTNRRLLGEDLLESVALLEESNISVSKPVDPS